jgi:hypothetical protein
MERLGSKARRPFRILETLIGVDSAKKGASPHDVLEAKNRPTMADHVETIAKYRRGGSVMLEIQDLHAYYGKSHILQGVNLYIDLVRSSACWGATASDAPRLSKPSWERFHRRAR